MDKYKTPFNVISSARSETSDLKLRDYFETATHAFLFIWFSSGSDEALQYAKREIKANGQKSPKAENYENEMLKVIQDLKQMAYDQLIHNKSSLSLALKKYIETKEWMKETTNTSIESKGCEESTDTSSIEN